MDLQTSHDQRIRSFIHRARDLQSPGTTASLDVTRSYRSLDATRVGAFGVGWTSLLDVRLVGVGTDRIVAHTADGDVVDFVTDRGRWVTSDRCDPWLEVAPGSEPGPTRWALVDGSTGGRRFLFDALGVLTGWQVGASIVDVARSGEDRVVGLVERRSGRSIAIAWAGGLVSELKTDDRRMVAYDYSSDPLLRRVATASRTIHYSYGERFTVAAHDADGAMVFVDEYTGGRHGAGRRQRSTTPGTASRVRPMTAAV